MISYYRKFILYESYVFIYMKPIFSMQKKQTDLFFMLYAKSNRINAKAKKLNNKIF